MENGAVVLLGAAESGHRGPEGLRNAYFFFPFAGAALSAAAAFFSSFLLFCFCRSFLDIAMGPHIGGPLLNDDRRTAFLETLGPFRSWSSSQMYNEATVPYGE